MTEGGEEQTTSGFSTTSVVFFGLVTLAIYYVILKPLVTTTRPTEQQQQQLRARRQNIATNNNTNGGIATTTTISASTSEITLCLDNTTTGSQIRRKPPHAISSEAQLVDGMISFRHTTSSKHPDSSTDATRRERAKVLSRILSLSKDSSGAVVPPSRGKIIVLSIPQEDIDCNQLRRILYLLASYFTLILVVNVDTSSVNNNNHNNTPLSLNNAKQIKETNKMIVSKLRNDESTLPSSVLPDHRIIMVSSRVGKIALVRQLSKARVEFVLDYDTELPKELERFGFRVFLYGTNSDKENNGASNTKQARLSRQLMG